MDIFSPRYVSARIGRLSALLPTPTHAHEGRPWPSLVTPSLSNSSARAAAFAQPRAAPHGAKRRPGALSPLVVPYLQRVVVAHPGEELLVLQAQAQRRHICDADLHIGVHADGPPQQR